MTNLEWSDKGHTRRNALLRWRRSKKWHQDKRRVLWGRSYKWYNEVSRRFNPKCHIKTTHDWSDEVHTRTNTRLICRRSYQDDRRVIWGMSHNTTDIKKVTEDKIWLVSLRLNPQRYINTKHDRYDKKETRLYDWGHIRTKGEWYEEGHTTQLILRRSLQDNAPLVSRRWNRKDHMKRKNDSSDEGHTNTNTRLIWRRSHIQNMTSGRKASDIRKVTQHKWYNEGHISSNFVDTIMSIERDLITVITVADNW